MTQQLDHLKLGGPIAKGKLPDFDSMSADDLANLAENARAEEEALERIYAALSEATVSDKLGLACLAILNVRECPIESDLPDQFQRLVFNKISDETLISLAIAILEGLQSSDDSEEEG